MIKTAIAAECFILIIAHSPDCRQIARQLGLLTDIPRTTAEPEEKLPQL
jgi:hypothetical protein